MLNGLEVSERKLLAVAGETKEFRIDSPFFKKEYLAAKAAVEKAGAAVLEDDASLSIRHPAEIKRNYVSDGGVWFLRAQNLRPMHIDDGNKVFVSDEDAKTLSRNILREGDLLITRTGAAGTAAVFAKKTALASSHIFIVRSKMFCHYYLMAYLNCRYGRLLADRGIYGGLQPEISQTYLKGMPVYRASKTLQSRIRQVVQNAYKTEATSANLYAKAEHDLLRHLGLLEWQPQERSHTIKTFRESIGASGRMDAEYYQPKYEIIAAIEKGKYAPLENIAVIKKSIEPGSAAYRDEGIPFVRVADLSKFDIAPTAKYLHPDEYRKHLDALRPRKNTILFSKDGTLGIAYKTEADLPIITSGAILHLTARKPKEVLPDYLALVLNSPPVQMQAERDSGGAVIQHWRLSDVKKISVPLLPVANQRALADSVKQSFAMRTLSKQLLNNARQAVEIAIEQGETKALTYLKKQTTD